MKINCIFFKKDLKELSVWKKRAQTIIDKLFWNGQRKWRYPDEQKQKQEKWWKEKFQQQKKQKAAFWPY